MKIQVSGPDGPFYRTRSGNKVRIYATDGVGSFPIQGAIQITEKTWEAELWKNDGQYVDQTGELSHLDISAPWESLLVTKEMVAMAFGAAYTHPENAHKELDSSVGLQIWPELQRLSEEK